MTETLPATYRFGPFELRPVERQLLRDGQPQGIGGRAFDLLLVLVERAGELVTKEQLLERAWPSLVVEDANVHVQVSMLRKLLGADAVGTVAGLGYRFTLPLARGSTPPSLPAERTAFVGREAALAEAADRLATTRLLSFVGIGGTGKTRLALKLAERSAGRRTVCWVDLVPVESAEALLAAVMRAAGCSAPIAPASAIDALATHLRGQATLLLLDNCEHLLDPAASLVDRLLAAVPSLAIVATSREALDLPGEAVLPVRPLELPLPGDADAASSEAVRLFAQRATLAGPGFTLDADRLEAVVSICRQLDGIPLALELAAAQLRLVSLEQLRAMLGERVRQLSGSRRTPARQQTLAAVLQWTHDHLRPIDQRLLQHLAVCAGGCDLEAVEALCADDAAEPGAARTERLEGLARLADHCLIEVRPGLDVARYVLLETVRQDALARLQDAGGLHQARERHAAHFLARAEAGFVEIAAGGSGEAVLQRLDADRDNLLRALDWWDRAGDPEAARLAIRLVVALRGWWPARGTSPIGLKRTLAALARSRELPHDAIRGLAMATATHMLWQSGEYAAAQALASEHAPLAEAAGDGDGASLAHLQIGNLACSMHRLDDARLHYQRAIDQAESLGMDQRVADALHGMASIAAAESRLDDAQQLYDRVLDMRRRESHAPVLATALANGASTAMDRGDVPLARERMLELLGLLEPTGSRYVAMHTLRLSGKLLALQGEADMATAMAAAAQRSRDETGLQGNAAAGKGWDADLNALRRSLGEAAYDAAWRHGFTMDEAAALKAGEDRLRAIG